jgi:hypothetical protein
MDTGLRDISPVQIALLIGRSYVIKKLATDAGIAIGEAPFDARTVDAAWEKVVVQPLPVEHHDWIVGSFGGLVIDHFTKGYGFEAKELTDEHGTSLCLVEPRTGIQIFPFDSVGKRINERRGFFVSLFGQLEAVLNEHGVRRLAPDSSRATPNPITSNERGISWLSRVFGKKDKQS